MKPAGEIPQVSTTHLNISFHQQFLEPFSALEDRIPSDVLGCYPKR